MQLLLFLTTYIVHIHTSAAMTDFEPEQKNQSGSYGMSESNQAGHDKDNTWSAVQDDGVGDTGGI